MKLPILVLLATGGAALLISCSTAPAQQARSPKAANELAEALAGRSPGPPTDCIPNYRSDNMQVIDDYTILFRSGRTIYVQNPPGGCHGLGFGAYTLVSQKFGTDRLCRGDINRLVDLRTGMGGGSCVFGPFVPYTRR